jgi:hypothetical protein
MSIREQERRQKEAEKRIEGEMRRADRQVRGSMEARAREAEKRAGEVVRRIEKGDVQPRPLPNLREDSMASMESMQSMGSMESMRSIESAETVSEVTGEANAQGMQEGMPLEGIMPYDPQGAGEDLAQRVTEETGAGGDPHAHNEQKADEIAADMTEDTGAGGDMNLDAERRVEGMGQRMFED